MAPRMHLQAAVLAALVVGGQAAGQLKIGGPIQDSYVSAFMVWVDGHNAKSDKQYTVETHFKTYADASFEADVTAMTTPGDEQYVDALLCPYTSGAVIKCVDAVHNDYAGPIMVWGGASDTIFDSSCTDKACFGFFSVGSSYTHTGLAALNEKMTEDAQVAVITNSNGFSQSVFEGAKSYIEDNAGLNKQSETTISVEKADLTDGDKTKIKAAMDQRPDIVVIAGHNKDVEPAIVEIGKGTIHPKAILATNGLTALENYGEDSKYANCVMMPTQWAEGSTTDPVVGWTSADFKTAMGGSATYQQAAAGAVCVALANAMEAGSNDKAKLVEKLKTMDVDSFYGKLKWDSAGRISKPMYTQQKQGDNMAIVAPTGSVSFPITGDSCWGTGTKETDFTRRSAGLSALLLMLTVFAAR